MKFRKVSITFCAGALLVPVLLANSAEAEPEPKTARADSPAADDAMENLRVNYESGTLNSGVDGLSTTAAMAPDASGVVQPGSGSSYAVQHKVTLGDPAYESNGAPRSESATDLIEAGRFDVGDEHRYEFSVLLKDWKTSPGSRSTN